MGKRIKDQLNPEDFQRACERINRGMPAAKDAERRLRSHGALRAAMHQARR